jgi:citrate lyase subunit beta/citryl-CoA lyase
MSESDQSENRDLTAEFGNLPPRSKLFVPGNRPELFAKALSSDADAVCFDLEDAVLPSQKIAARNEVRDFLANSPNTDKELIVRVNGIRSEYFSDDLDAIVNVAVTTIALPKTEAPSEIEELAEELSLLEKRHKIGRQIAILPTIESPRGLRHAAAIAEANPRVTDLQLGLADLFYSLGIPHDDQLASHHVRMELRLTAGEAGVGCFDSACLVLGDLARFTEESLAARSLGFSGKSCVHPLQVPIANQVFSPTPEELALSLQIVDAARTASQSGTGVFTLDGRVIDEPVVKHAARLIQIAARLKENSKIRK